jgi:hypothetical protein
MPIAALLVEHLTDAPVPPGFAMWRVEDGAPVVMPAPAPDAPDEFLHRYFARLVATSTGLCPMCGERAGLSHDPETAPAAWRLQEVTYGISHGRGCPCLFTESDRRYFDARGLGR